MSFECGEHIGAYKLVQCCGSGAYGEVFVAENLLTGERAALKKLFPTAKTMERELAGLIRWRECRHPNLIRIWHVEETADAFYYTMDLADDLNAGQGEYLPDTLANRLGKRGKLSPGEVEKLADAFTNALKFLHGKGFIHRDIKPDNILWINGVPTLGDPGLAASADGGSLVGTPEFMSAEVLQKKRAALPEDDFYALRLVLYCAFTGEAPGSYPHCPAELLTPDSAALWRRILEPEAAAPLEHRKNRAIRYLAVATALLLLAAAAFFALWRQPVPSTGARQPVPKYAPAFMLDRELPKLLEQYREDEAEYRFFSTGAEAHSRKFYENLNALRNKLRFQKAFGHLNEGEYAAALKKLDRRAAAGMKRDVYLKLHDCQLRLSEHLEKAHMYPIHATGGVAEQAERNFFGELHKLLEERHSLLKRLRAEPELAGTFALPHSLWSMTDELKKEAPQYHWGIAAKIPKIEAFYEQHRSELCQAAAQLSDGGDPTKLKKRLEELTAKYSGEDKLLCAICLLYAKYNDFPTHLEHTAENYCFYAELFRLNRELVEHLYREYPQYRP